MESSRQISGPMLVEEPLYNQTPPPARDPEGGVDIWRGISGVAHYSRWIAAAAIVAGLLAGIRVWMMPRQFEALATVFVVTPMFTSSLTPVPSSVQSYTHYAELIRPRVLSELQKQGGLPPDSRLTRARTVLYPTDDREKPHLPVIGFEASAVDPVTAQRYANLWATIFIREQSALTKLGKSGSVDFILNEYPKAIEQVALAQSQVKLAEDRHARQLGDFDRNAAPTMQASMLASRESLLVQLSQELERTRIDLRSTRESVTQLGKELAATPTHHTVYRGMSDDVIWSTAGRGNPPPELAARMIRSQEVNQVHSVLSERLSFARVSLQSTIAREQALVQQIRDLTTQTNALRARVTGNGVTRAAMIRAHALEIDRLNRAVQEAQARFKKLDEKIGEAQIAKAESDTDLRLGEPARLPTEPVERPYMRSVITASATVAGFGILLAWIAAYVPAGVFRRGKP